MTSGFWFLFLKEGIYYDIEALQERKKVFENAAGRVCVYEERAVWGGCRGPDPLKVEILKFFFKKRGLFKTESCPDRKYSDIFFFRAGFSPSTKRCFVCVCTHKHILLFSGIVVSSRQRGKVFVTDLEMQLKKF